MARPITHHTVTAQLSWRSWEWVRALLRRRAAPELPLLRGERLLVAGQDADGAPYAATDRALVHRIGTTWRRVGWEQVDHISWSASANRLTLATPRIHDASAAAIRLVTPTPVVDLVRERVAATMVITADITLDGTPVRIVGRRVPGGEDVHWLVVAASAISEDEVAAAVRTLRTELGLPPGGAIR